MKMKLSIKSILTGIAAVYVLGISGCSTTNPRIEARAKLEEGRVREERIEYFIGKKVEETDNYAQISRLLKKRNYRDAEFMLDQIELENLSYMKGFQENFLKEWEEDLILK